MRATSFSSISSPGVMMGGARGRSLGGKTMRVLLAIDESQFSKQAERALLTQLRRTGTQVRVLNVIEPIASYVSADLFPHLVSHTAQIEQDRRRQAKELVERVARRLRKAGFKATEVVDAGDPKTKIVEHAAKWPADLVVLGSHGLKGLDRFVMGSVSAAVSQHAGCSVEIVRSRIAAKQARGTKRSRPTPSKRRSSPR
jgi:nucleotide-binding universal stress UspA family protein